MARGKEHCEHLGKQMPETNSWNGSTWGAASCTLLAEITRDGQRITGKFLLFEPGLGQLYAQMAGEWRDDNTISAGLQQFTGQYSVPVELPQTGRMTGVNSPTSGCVLSAARRLVVSHP